jgi:acyl transferase domain-containing protein/thioesterase domain-containing protein
MAEEVDQLDKIAVIGMAGRFPSASSIEEFGRNLCSGVESVSVFTDEQLLGAGVPSDLVHAPNYVKAGVLFDGTELFDAAFFGYTPREAELTDPQHRIFLENAWEAMEDAGYDPERTRQRVGVFAGASANTYLQNNLFSNPGLIHSLHYLQRLIAGENDYLSTRVSYKLNLKGPSLTIQTACSSSLVAVHVACQSLLSGECDMALAGGVSLHVPQISGYLYEEGSTLSPDGHCRAFDASAKGMVNGSGAAVIVLKRLSDAIEDGDSIRAVICGSAINNDGASKAGYTTPSIEGPASAIAAAHALSGVSADDISYVEAMGTGTTLGDPIEVAGLTKAFRRTSQRKGFCSIGSVKTNIGHLGAASGIAGLVKVILGLQKKVLFPSLNFQQPNPAIDFVNSPFYVQQSLEAWQPAKGRRVAGVSSFGVGGTNAHVVVEEAPAAVSEKLDRWQLLPVSARTPAALEKATDRLAEFLASHPGLNLADVAFTLQQGRKAFAHRRVIAAKSADEAAALLRARDPRHVFSGSPQSTDRTVAFLFPGEAPQYVNMGLELYRTEKTFREQVDFCCQFLKPHLGFDLRQALYPAADKMPEAAAQFKQAAVAQVAIFVVDYALARTWMQWGVNPDAMIGRGIGEYVAACLAGVFSLADALIFVASGGRLDGVKLQSPKIPFVSNVTGSWITPSDAAEPAYWSNHFNQGARFADGLNELFKAPGRILLQVGPGQTLGVQGRNMAQTSGHVVLSSFGNPEDGISEGAGLMTTLGRLWAEGVRPDWRALSAGQKRTRVSLPTYPFERQRHWIEARQADANAAPVENGNSPQHGDLEEMLAAVWREVLGYKQIASDDNFFDLGGTSFLATILLSRLRAQLHVDLAPNTLFLAPTIASLAKLITRAAARGEHEVVVPLQKGSSSRPPFFLVHSYHLYGALPRALGVDQPFYGVEEFAVSDPVDNWGLESMMSRYVEGIRAAEPHGPYFIAGFCSASIPAFEVARQLEEAGESVPLLVIIDPVGTSGTGQVQQGPLGRVCSTLQGTGAFWRFHIGKMKSLSAKAMLGYAKTLTASKLRNFSTNRQIWLWRRIIRMYMRCGFKIPNALRRKLISGIRVVTLEAIRAYSPKPYKGDIAVFLGTETDLELQSGDITSWRNATSGTVHEIWLPGGHASAFVEPHLSVFAQELRDALDASLAEGLQSSSGSKPLSKSSL